MLGLNLGLNLDADNEHFKLELEAQCFLQAASEGDIETIQHYIQSSILEKIPAYYKGGALRFATKHNQLETLRILLKSNLEEGLPANSIGQCFIIAGETGNQDIALLLLDSKAEKITPHYKTAYLNAIAKNQHQLEQPTDKNRRLRHSL